ncbi:MAG: acyl-CoA thioesterase [Actinomycetota bacterium]
MSSPVEITVRRRIHWFDTDTSTKEHNSAPLRWMEEAEAELLDRLGLVKELYGHLPRVHVDMDYRIPLRFWDEVDVTVRVSELGRTSITYRFDVRKNGEVAVEGRVTAVHIDETGEPSVFPEGYRKLLEGSATPS